MPSATIVPIRTRPVSDHPSPTTMLPVPMSASRMVRLNGSAAPPENRGPNGWPVWMRLRITQIELMPIAPPANAAALLSHSPRWSVGHNDAATITAPEAIRPTPAYRVRKPTPASTPPMAAIRVVSGVRDNTSNVANAMAAYGDSLHTIDAIRTKP